jgi:hypothetical protein
MGPRLDIALQRNEDWGRELALTSGDEIIDLTGSSVALQIRDKLSQALIASGTVEVVDPTNGAVQVLIRGSVPPLSTYGAQIQVANLHYDIRLTDPDGFQTILFGGVLVLYRGETRA